MKAALATLAVILSSLAASAQIVEKDLLSNQTVSRTFFLPCANGGKGDTVVFTGIKVRTILHSAFDSLGHIHGDGFFLYADDLKGKGAVRQYEADGSELDTWTGVTDPDGNVNDEDGTFTFTSDYHITTRHGDRDDRHRHGRNENIMFHLVQQFTVFNNGNNLTEQPTITVCK